VRILHLIYDHTRNPWVGGGGAMRVFEIYRRLAKRHSVTVICGKYPGARDYMEDDLSFRFIGTDKKNYILSTLSYAFQSAKLLKSIYLEFDVIVEDFAPWNPLFSFTLPSRPVILQVQNYLGFELINKYGVFGLPFWFMEKYYPRKFKYFVVLVDSLIQRYGIRGNIRTISQGFDRSYLVTPAVEGEDIIFIGRIDIHQKGLDTLAKAMRMVKTKFVVVGTGKDRDRFLRMCSGITNLAMPGFVGGHYKIGILMHAKCLVLPSRYEGQGIVVLEAAALGKPVIVSDIPELRYAVDAGFGLSFKTGNAEDLAEKIKFLLNNEPSRKKMGQRAREYAKNYTWDKIAEDYEKYLIEIKDTLINEDTYTEQA
jgi:glycosyltransferase involved in cell wall biosynthesis